MVSSEEILCRRSGWSETTVAAVWGPQKSNKDNFKSALSVALTHFPTIDSNLHFIFKIHLFFWVLARRFLDLLKWKQHNYSFAVSYIFQSLEESYDINEFILLLGRSTCCSNE